MFTVYEFPAKRKTRTLSIRFPKEVYAGVEALAQKYDMSISRMVNRIIREQLLKKIKNEQGSL